MSINEIIMSFKNSHAVLPEISAEELSSLSHEELVRVLNWLIVAVNLDAYNKKPAPNGVFQRAAWNINEEFYDDSLVKLSTYPEDKTKFEKTFEVEHDWLIDTLIELDIANRNEGVDLSLFLQNYDWYETEVIYQAAKMMGKIHSEEELVITKELISHAFTWGYVQLRNANSAVSETVCRIGENWFYFGGETAEELSPQEYRKAVPHEDIVNEIFSALESFRENEEYSNEYAYYEAYLSDMRNLEVFVVDTLIYSQVEYRRIPGSLRFEVLDPCNKQVQYHVVKITDSCMIDVDGTLTSCVDFTSWAESMTPVTARLELIRATRRTAFQLWNAQGRPEASSLLNDSNFDIIERYRQAFPNAAGYKFHKGIVNLSHSNNHVFCADYIFNCTEENEKKIIEAEKDFIKTGRFVRLSAALENADGIALVWS